MPITPDLRRTAATTAGLSRAGVPRLVQQTFPHVSEEQWAGYNAVILLVSLIAIGMLAVGVVVELTPTARSLLAYVDLAVCGVFMVDFGISLVRAPNRWQYLLTWGWIDLLSSIPVINSLRWGRAARVVQGTGEEATFDDDQLGKMLALAKKGVTELTKRQLDCLS